MQFIKQARPALTPLAIALLALTASMPAAAETEIEALKRELAEQRQLIQKLVAAQEAKQAVPVAPAAPAAPVPPAAPALTIYGVADVNVSRADSGFGAKTNVGTGGMGASRLGLKGEKQIGNGIKAVYVLEAGLSLNTGTVGTGTPALGINNTVPSNGGLTSAGTQFFSRQIYAGLATPVGTITAGRQYSGSYLASVTTGNAMGAGLYGSSATLLPITAAMPTRLNNSLVYLSPKWRGLSAHLTLSSGNGNNVSGGTGTAASSTTDEAGRAADLAVSYANGPLNAAVTTWHVENASFNPSLGETGLAAREGFQLAANYALGFAKVYGTYMQGKIGGGGYEQGTRTLSKTQAWSLSAAAPLAGGTVLASFSRVDDQSLIANRDVDLLGVAYTYKLHDATTLYASWGRTLNDVNAPFSLTNAGDLVGTLSAPGFKPSAFMVGLNQTF